MSISKRIKLEPDDFHFQRIAYIKFLSDYEIATLFPVQHIREMKEKKNCIEVYIDFNIQPSTFPITKFNYSEYQRYKFFYSVK